MGQQLSCLFRCCVGGRRQSPSDPPQQPQQSPSGPPQQPQQSAFDLKQILAKSDLTKADLISIRDFIKQALCKLKDGTESSSSSSSGNEMSANANDLIQAAPQLLNAISDESDRARNDLRQIDQADDGIALTIFSNILEVLGALHWVACSLSLVAYLLKQMITRSANKKEAIELLDEMVDLASELVDKYEHFSPDNKTFKKAIGIIIDGTMSCCDLRSGSVIRILAADADANLLINIRQKMELIKLDIMNQYVGELLNRVAKPYQASEPGQPSREVAKDKRVEEVMTLLSAGGSAPRALIIHGIGGIGKSTLLDKVCKRLKGGHSQDLSFKYANISLPLDDKNPITHWQQVLYEILTGKAQKFIDEKQGQSELLKQMKELNKPILLSIDNALEEKQLNMLLPEELNQLPSGSLILVTTRNVRVKNKLKEKGIQELKEYQVDKLPEGDSRNILEQTIGEHIMKRIVKKDFVALLKSCDGHPLALIIAGNFIHHEVEDGVSPQKACEYVLDSLKHHPEDEGDRIGEEELFKALGYSINHLPNDSKTTFLDIVAFFNMSDEFTWDEVKDIYDPIPFKRLEDRSLIKKRDNKVQVHDLLCSLARHQMSNKGATRIKGAKELELLLNQHHHIENLNLQQIEGLDLGQNSDVNIPADKLKQMTSLRLLFNIPPLQDNMHLQVCLQAFSGYKLLHLPFSNTDNLHSLYIYESPEFDLINLFSQPHFKFLTLQHLQLSGCMTSSMTLPQKGIAKLKCLKTLQITCCCTLQTLPEDLWSLTSLQKLNLEGCESLEALPAIKGMGQSCCIQYINLTGCTGLNTLPEDLWSLTSLQELDHRRCKSLEALPAIKGMGQSCCIPTLDLTGCTGLKTLPEDLWSLTSLQKLDLEGCESLEALPAIKGTEQSCCIQTLSLTLCIRLKTLPEDLWSLTSLQKLSLWRCKSLEALPAIKGMGQSCCIQRLDLSTCTGLKTLPEDLWSLTSLQKLNLWSCESLEALPTKGMGQSCCIQTLDLIQCTRLKTLPEDIWSLTSLQQLDLWNCQSLEALPAIKGMGQSCCIQTLYLTECTRLKTLPKDLWSLTSLEQLDLSKCYSLEALPAIKGMGQSCCIQRLNLSGCTGLKTLPEDLWSLTSLQKLDLKGCKSLEALPAIKGMGQSCCIQTLYLTECTRLKTLPKDLWSLTSLQQLDLSKCYSLEALPAIKGMGQSCCIQRINISGCTGLKTLPEDLWSLTSLKELLQDW